MATSRIQEIEKKLQSLRNKEEKLHEDYGKVVQGRHEENLKRKLEDDAFKDATTEIDIMEESLRREMKKLKRGSLGVLPITPEHSLSPLLEETNVPENPLLTPSESPNSGTPAKMTLSEEHKRKMFGTPDRYTPTGAGIWEREDGNPVTLQCNTSGCKKKGFWRLCDFQRHLKLKHDWKGDKSRESILKEFGVPFLATMRPDRGFGDSL